MTEFKVGDPVIPLDYQDDSTGPWYGAGTVTREYEGSGSCVLVKMDNEYDMIGGFLPDRLEHVELYELSKFRDDAIAKYPDLAPMSEEDKFVNELYSEWMNNDTKDCFRKAIQWGKDHA